MMRPEWKQRQQRGGKILVALWLMLGIEASFTGLAYADQPPPELKMILAPGSASSGVITFSAEDDQAPVEKTVQPTPMTVLPPAATAESARQREKLVSGEGRPQALAYPNSFTMGAGYRWDSLVFNIAPLSGPPNILSELSFEDLESMTVSAGMRWSNSSNLYVRGGVEIGRTISGEVQDSDYYGNNRTLEFSRSYADGDGGSMLDADIALGYRFDLPLASRESTLQLMPVLGYSYHSQEVAMSNGLQVISDYGFGAGLGPFAGLDSNYDAHWAGPFIGLDMEWAFNQQHALMATLEYHWVDYEADANWNLRSDFAHPISFEHESEGDGVVASITYRYTPNPKWFWTIGFQYSKFEADAGQYTYYSADNSPGYARFNEAEWESCAVVVGLGFKF